MLKSLDNFFTTLVLKIPQKITPNKVTWIRIFLIPLIWALYQINPWAATGVFALVAATDFVDGRLARARNIVTEYGKKLDITCDLTLVWSTVILLLYEGVIPVNSFLFWLLVFMLVRETILMAIRELFQVVADDVRVNKLGKCKTASFMLGLVVLLTSTVWSYGASVGTGLIALAAVCSLISGIQYIQQFSKSSLD